ncbi:hypothetical protein DAPPUDRAFT_240811 [Daphnia pulex]|uniref:Ionotropic glutamate receptor L-glutamate and glycine-binding domain-containing protein n=1 Tax=Daphnia pulex TaxID=6669 RepID=E9GCM4_DAPPU|nr:hypothetical protein DAPPUDRAFT_240811 [Daphnia pulex]|eukprot:EFX82839.1 hypothetical protein DAPPUDRAFT_240811 [Daphnia pulex]
MLNKASDFLCWLVALFLSPLVKDKELTTVSMGIFEEIILNILADKMKFTYEIIPPSDILTLGYLQPNGSWTGTTGQLQRKEVDMCVTTSAPASSKTPVQDISYPVVYVDSAIVIPFPKEETKWIVTSTFKNKEASTNPTLKKIADNMRKHPERRILNAFTVDDISTIVKEEAALVLVKSTAESFIENSYKINKECRVTLAEKTFFSRPQTFSYPKHSPIVKTVDYNLLLLQQAGLIQYAEKRSAVPYNRCSVSEAKKIAANKVVPLKLKDVAGAFSILILGFILSFILLFIECIFKKMSTK